MVGALATMASVMPVRTLMKGGIGAPGRTRVWNSPSTSPPRTLTAPTSVIDASWGDPPVVSRSTTTKVTSWSGDPSSSKDVCRGRGVAGGVRSEGAAGRGAGSCWCGLNIVGPTVRAGSDRSGQAHRAPRAWYWMGFEGEGRLQGATAKGKGRGNGKGGRANGGQGAGSRDRRRVFAWEVNGKDAATGVRGLGLAIDGALPGWPAAPSSRSESRCDLTPWMARLAATRWMSERMWGNGAVWRRGSPDNPALAEARRERGVSVATKGHSTGDSAPDPRCCAFACDAGQTFARERGGSPA